MNTTNQAQPAPTLNPEAILRYFEYEHLPEPLRQISKDFHDQAHRLVERLPRNPERTMTLRKLLEAKDCAVRAALDLLPSSA